LSGKIKILYILNTSLSKIDPGGLRLGNVPLPPKKLQYRENNGYHFPHQRKRGRTGKKGNRGNICQEETPPSEWKSQNVGNWLKCHHTLPKLMTNAFRGTFKLIWATARNSSMV
jgi:hypothetical protein